MSCCSAPVWPMARRAAPTLLVSVSSDTKRPSHTVCKLAREFSKGVSMPVPDPKAFGITDPADAEWLKAKCTPHPLQTYETRLTLKNPIGNGLPVTYIAVKPDYGPTVAC